MPGKSGLATLEAKCEAKSSVFKKFRENSGNFEGEPGG